MIFRQISHWITAPENVVSAPLFLKKFTTNKPINSALCKISGIGCYVLTLDGSRVDDFLLKLPEKTKCTFINSLDENCQHLLTVGINEFVI